MEEIFRKRVCQTYGKGKGKLGKALTEAMFEWARKKKCLDACMNLLDEGRVLGKLKYKSREELYDRR